jgi:hypothetical protein
MPIVVVKTLAIRGTAEEYMSQRRQVLKGSAQKVPSMTNEVGMRDFIAVRLEAIDPHLI